MKRIATGSIVWLLALWTAAAPAQQGGFPPAQVEVVAAQVREMAPTVSVSGTVISLNDSRIASEVEGVLVGLAEVGQAVEAGEVIARIDPRLLEVAVKRAEANVARLEADLQYRERLLERNRNLAESNNASATLLDESRAQRDMALHQLEDARAWLEQARGDLARSAIRAPFAGHVTARLASLGEYVAVGEDVVRLVDTRRLEITLPAPLNLAPYIQPGMPVTVTGNRGERRHTVRTVVPVGDAVSRMLEVRLSVDEGDWLVGAPVQVALPSDHPVTTVAVPRDALVQRGGQSFVYKVNGEGTADQIVAEVRAAVGLWVGLSGGVEAGDRVIVRGAERLQPGQPVSIVGGSEGR